MIAAEQYIIVLGNPIDGLGFLGPFPSRQSAEAWMEMHDKDYPDAEWWTAPLFPVRNPDQPRMELIKS